MTLPIDDALFASCKEILAKYDPHYDPGTLPANLEEAKSDLTKMTAMQASIERAQQALEAKASAMTGGLSIREACAALDAQIMALTAQVQQKDNEIIQLQQKLETAAPEEQDAIRAEIESKKGRAGRFAGPAGRCHQPARSAGRLQERRKHPSLPPGRPCRMQQCC